MEEADSQKPPTHAEEDAVSSAMQNIDCQVNEDEEITTHSVVEYSPSNNHDNPIDKPRGAISVGNTESRSKLPLQPSGQDGSQACEVVEITQDQFHPKEGALYVRVIFSQKREKLYMESFIREKLAAVIDNIVKVNYGEQSAVILVSSDIAATEMVQLFSMERNLMVESIEKLFQRIQVKNARLLKALNEEIVVLEHKYAKLATVAKNKFIPIAEYEMKSLEKDVVRVKIDECKQRRNEFTNYVQNQFTSILSSEMQVEMVDTLEVKMKCERKHLSLGLPIYSRRSEIVEVVSKSNVTVLVGETGSGKSTQVVQYIHAAGIAGNGIIVCTQPRKVAAITLANRVSDEMDVDLGDKLGYKVGMSEKCNKNTQILYMTDHMLLNECIADRTLSKYSCILIDEAHERSINTDMLLAFLKQCLPNRSDLKLVIMSATIEPELFVRYFKMGAGHNDNVVSTIKVSGRTFPVEVKYDPMNSKEELSSKNDYVINAVDVVREIHKDQPLGDILVFLTCAPEIEKACTKLASYSHEATILPLHGKLPPQEQQKVFQPSRGRKIIFSTNVAETSVTIPGVKYVVDTGLAKEMHFDSRKGMDSLEVCMISKSSAEQRKGRAGRVSAGKCYRLYCETDYESKMPERTKPEILRIQLSQVVLKMLQFGVPNVLNFDYVETPDQIALKSAVDTLECIGAINNQQLTKLGKKMAVLPLQPQLSKVLLDAIDADIGTEALISVALSSLAGQVFFRGGDDEMKKESDISKLDFCHLMGDQITNLSVYQCWLEKDKNKQKQWCVDNFVNSKSMHIVQEMVKELRMTLKVQLKMHLGLTIDSLDAAECYLRKLYFYAFINNMAVYLGHPRAGYMTTALPNGDPFLIFPGSSLCYLGGSPPKYVIYERTLKTSRQFLTNVMCVQREWVDEAVATGKLAEDPAVTFSEHMCLAVHAEYAGPQTYKEIKHKDIVFESNIVVPPVLDFSPEPKEWGVIRYIAQRKNHTTVKFSIEDAVQKIRKRMMEATEEYGLTGGQDSTRVLIGSGGNVKQIIMPYHFRSVNAICSDQGMSFEQLKTHFEQFGKVTQVKTLKEKPELRVRVTYATTFQAQQAIKSSCADVNIYPYKGQQFSLKLEWKRRNRAPHAHVSFDSERNRDATLAAIRGRVYWGHIPIKISEDKFNRCKLFLQSKILIQLDEVEFKEHLKTYIHYNFSVRMGYMKYNGECPYVEDRSCHQQYKKNIQENHPEDDRASSDEDEEVSSSNEDDVINHEDTLKQFKLDIEDTLRRMVRKYMESGTCQINFILPRFWHINYRAFITFNDPDEGYRVLYSDLDKEEIFDGRRISVSPNLKCTLTFRQNIFTLIRSDIERAKKEVQCSSKEIFIKVIPPDQQFKDITRVTLTAHDVKVFSTAQDKLYKAAEPLVLDCNTTELQEYILSQNYQKDMEIVQTNTSTFISREINTMVIKIYGTKENRDQAKCYIEEKANDLFSDGATVTQLSLRGDGMPPGLMKHLVTMYRCDLSGLLQFEGVRKVTLTPNRQLLSVLATSTGLETVKKCMEEVSPLPTLATTGEYSFDCSACFTPIDDPKDMFRLECCGHGFHIDCIEVQLKQDTITFPLCCASENCPEEFVLADFQNLQRRLESFRLQFLVSAAVQHFMAKNGDKYKNCPTPDCKMIYPQTDVSKPFSCNRCFVVTCSKCHKQYHAGISCEVLYANIICQSDEHFLQWMREDPANRKRCPKCGVPIEKNMGCSHMTCKCGTHICWNCMMIFKTASDCYNHQTMCRRPIVDTAQRPLQNLHPAIPDAVHPPPAIIPQQNNIPNTPQNNIPNPPPRVDVQIAPLPHPTVNNLPRVQDQAPHQNNERSCNIL